MSGPVCKNCGVFVVGKLEHASIFECRAALRLENERLRRALADKDDLIQFLACCLNEALQKRNALQAEPVKQGVR